MDARVEFRAEAGSSAGFAAGAGAGAGVEAGAGAPVLGHAARVAGEPHALRFAVAGPVLPAGRLQRAPGALGKLIAAGTVDRVLVEPHGLWVRLGGGAAWSDVGAGVRDALADALAEVGGWAVVPDDDAVLACVAHDVLTGEMVDYIASHGGEITLLGASGGVVRVTLGGACSHCELASVTLGLRLENAIRARVPSLIEVRDETPRQSRQLFSFVRRR